MAPASKANYKSFEAQARLIRAMVAAHPDTKWNYKGKTRLFFCSASPPLPARSPFFFRPCALGKLED